MWASCAGDRAAAAEAYRATLKKTAGVGSKTDIVLSMLRWAQRPGPPACSLAVMAKEDVPAWHTAETWHGAC